MIRQLWHVLFGHPWEFDEDLPIKFFTEFDIYLNKDVFMKSYYSRCHCGLRRFAYAAYIP